MSAANATIPAAVLPPFVDLSLSYGALLASVYIATFLYGMTCMQTFYYFVNYREDPWLIKATVALLWVLDTVHNILICVGEWNYLIPRFGDFAGLEETHPPFILEVLFTSFVSTVVQLFFIYRMQVFSGKKWLPLVLVPAVLSQPVLSIVYVVGCLQNPTVAGLLLFANLQIANSSIAAAVDVSIAAIMFVLLAKDRNGFSSKTDTMLVRLMVITVNTGLWTAIFAVVTVVTLVASPSTLIYCAAFTPICPLYCNTLIGNLNVRRMVRSAGAGMSKDHTSVHLPMSRFANSANSRSKNTELTVGVETSIQRDTESVEYGMKN